MAKSQPQDYKNLCLRVRFMNSQFKVDPFDPNILTSQCTCMPSMFICETISTTIPNEYAIEIDP